MRLHYVQHVPFESLGLIRGWAEKRGMEISSTALFERHVTLPTPDAYDVLIVMGGPMGVYDEEAFPWLREEKKHIREAIAAGKAVLGICLGAQLIANVLGAKVAPHTHKEIGWYPIAFTDEAAGHPLLAGLNTGMTVLHWHGDRFDIPEGALRLASSKACDNQAFLYGGRVLGLQFHLEMDWPSLAAICDGCAEELASGGPYVQSADTMLSCHYVDRCNTALNTLLDNWIHHSRNIPGPLL